MQAAQGFGGVALAGMLSAEAARAAGPRETHLLPRETHFPAKAKRIIFLYMDGGPSQVDTFDPKPVLAKFNGQDPHRVFKVEPTQFNNVGKVLQSPWGFKRYGQSGLPVSDLFPTIGRDCADDLCVIRSMVALFSEHTNANYLLHTGSGLQGRPAHGSWVAYGLGNECQNLPAYVVLNGGLIPSGGLDNFASGFLPATYQGSVFRPGKNPVANINPLESGPGLQAAKLELMRKLDRTLLGRIGRVDQVESAIANYELAARMQLAVPELMDLRDETKSTQQLYGMDDSFANTRKYGQLCLVARRMVERGVRFIELTCTGGNGDRWDQHAGLVDGHTKNSRAIDRPVAGLIRDLKQRGLLDETLVVWCGEFGRTPFAQGRNGRDHNPFGFSIWMAGGGVRSGYVHGATDDFGYHAVQDKVEIYDLHATMLHLLGMDHKRLTYRFSSRDMRLTDVHGRVVREVVA